MEKLRKIISKELPLFIPKTSSGKFFLAVRNAEENIIFRLASQLAVPYAYLPSYVYPFLESKAEWAWEALCCKLVDVFRWQSSP